MKVSVIIPVYNRAKYIVQAIESCLIQAEVGQVIVVDDGSTDDTVHLIRQIKDDRVCLFEMQINSGASAARNVGMKHVQCELVSFLDSDDYYLAHRFKEPIEVLIKHPQIDGTYESIKNVVDQNNTNSTTNHENVTELKGFYKPEKIFDAVSTDYVPFFHLISLVLRKEILPGKSFDLKLKFAEDKDFIYQILRKGMLISVNNEHCFIERRLHNENLTNAHSNEIVSYTNLFLEKWFQLIQKEDFSRRQVWNILYRKVSLDYLKNIKSDFFLIKLLGKFWILLWHLLSKPILVKKLLF